MDDRRPRSRPAAGVVRCSLLMSQLDLVGPSAPRRRLGSRRLDSNSSKASADDSCTAAARAWACWSSLKTLLVGEERDLAGRRPGEQLRPPPLRPRCAARRPRPRARRAALQLDGLVLQLAQSGLGLGEGGGRGVGRDPGRRRSGRRLLRGAFVGDGAGGSTHAQCEGEGRGRGDGQTAGEQAGRGVRHSGSGRLRDRPTTRRAAPYPDSSLDRNAIVILRRSRFELDLPLTVCSPFAS